MSLNFSHVASSIPAGGTLRVQGVVAGGTGGVAVEAGVCSDRDSA